MKKFILVLLFLTCPLAFSSALLKKVESTNSSMGREKLEQLYGKLQPAKGRFQSESEDYVFTISDKENYVGLKPKKAIFLKDLPYTHFEQGEMIGEGGGDLVLSSIVSVPQAGLYMVVTNDGLIKSFAWKAPWKGDKLIEKDEILKNDAVLKGAK